MSEKIENPPAFPSTTHTSQGYEVNGPCYGMTLRDYFAAKALTGIMADWSRHSGYNKRIDFDNREGDADVMAEQCYKLADAMLKARTINK